MLTSLGLSESTELLSCLSRNTTIIHQNGPPEGGHTGGQEAPRVSCIDLGDS